jgi:hypothetical protein
MQQFGLVPSQPTVQQAGSAEVQGVGVIGGLSVSGGLMMFWGPPKQRMMPPRSGLQTTLPLPVPS